LRSLLHLGLALAFVPASALLLLESAGLLLDLALALQIAAVAAAPLIERLGLLGLTFGRPAVNGRRALESRLAG